MRFYKLSTDELAKELETDFNSGLSQLQAEERLKKDGPNFRVYNNARQSKKGLMRVCSFSALAAFIYLLAALFKKDMGYLWYALLSFLIPALCSGLCHFYFKKIKRINSRITPMDYGKIQVMRDGRLVELSYKNITYGDIAYIKKGDYIPFDARIIEAENLIVDESDITSQKDVNKHAGDIEADNTDISDRYNMVLCSSYVTGGRAKVVVTDISDRVFIKRISGRKKRQRLAVKVSDFSKLLSLLMLVLSVVFSLICAIISSDYISFFAVATILSAVYTSDFLSSYIEAVFGWCYNRLYRKGIYVKSLSVIDRINAADTLIIKHNVLFDSSSEISGFVTEKDEYKQLSEVNKSNFSVFLYSSFCNDGIEKDSPYYSFKKLTVKILRGVGIDYHDIKAMCPVISRCSNADSGYDLCGIVYDGSNVLIARGDYTGVLKLCGKDELYRHNDVIEKLSRNSTEVIAVAVKQVDIIKDDLSSETDGFKLVGLIGLKRAVSQDKLAVINRLEKCGVHSIVLFPGNESSAHFLSPKKKTKFVSYKTIAADNGNVDLSCDVIYDFDGTVREVSEMCLKGKHRPCYIGEKSCEESDSVVFDSCSSDMADSRYSDVICENGLNDASDTIMNVKSAFCSVRGMLENGMILAAILIVCGTLFSLLYKHLMFSAPTLCITVFGGILLSAIITFKCSFVRSNKTAEFSFDPLQKQSVIFAALSTAMFILMTVILFFVSPSGASSGFIAVALQSFVLPNIFDVKKDRQGAAALILGFLPSVLTAIIFITPAASLFSVSDFTVLHAVTSVLSGVLIKYLCVLISRSVNF